MKIFQDCSEFVLSMVQYNIAKAWRFANYTWVLADTLLFISDEMSRHWYFRLICRNSGNETHSLRTTIVSRLVMAVEEAGPVDPRAAANNGDAPGRNSVTVLCESCSHRRIMFPWESWTKYRTILLVREACYSVISDTNSSIHQENYVIVVPMVQSHDLGLVIMPCVRVKSDEFLSKRNSIQIIDEGEGWLDYRSR